MKCKMWSGGEQYLSGGGGGGGEGTCGSNHLSCTKYKHAVYELGMGGGDHFVVFV